MAPINKRHQHRTECIAIAPKFKPIYCLNEQLSCTTLDRVRKPKPFDLKWWVKIFFLLINFSSVINVGYTNKSTYFISIDNTSSHSKRCFSILTDGNHLLQTLTQRTRLLSFYQLRRVIKRLNKQSADFVNAKCVAASGHFGIHTNKHTHIGHSSESLSVPLRKITCHIDSWWSLSYMINRMRRQKKLKYEK